MSQKPEKPTGLALLREPFPAHQISKLPKPTREQADAVRADFKKGIRCRICGGWHHPDAVHLDYVGHAALTDRLLDCDPAWNWEPVAFDEHGRPLFDHLGGMWIRLTVCGQTRLGYGHPDGKQGGNAIKEAIGDALRNAAMRFGAALDLWHKGDLHLDAPEDDDGGSAVADLDRAEAEAKHEAAVKTLVGLIESAETMQELKEIWITSAGTEAFRDTRAAAAKNKRKSELEDAE